MTWETLWTFKVNEWFAATLNTMLIYDQGIRNGRIGEASTAAMMAMPIFAGLIIVLTRYLQDKDEERV